MKVSIPAQTLVDLHVDLYASSIGTRLESLHRDMFELCLSERATGSYELATGQSKLPERMRLDAAAVPAWRVAAGVQCAATRAEAECGILRAMDDRRPSRRNLDAVTPPE